MVTGAISCTRFNLAGILVGSVVIGAGVYLGLKGLNKIKDEAGKLFSLRK